MSKHFSRLILRHIPIYRRVEKKSRREQSSAAYYSTSNNVQQSRMTNSIDQCASRAPILEIPRKSKIQNRQNSKKFAELFHINSITGLSIIYASRLRFCYCVSQKNWLRHFQKYLDINLFEKHVRLREINLFVGGKK